MVSGGTWKTSCLSLLLNSSPGLLSVRPSAASGVCLCREHTHIFLVLSYFSHSSQYLPLPNIYISLGDKYTNFHSDKLQIPESEFATISSPSWLTSALVFYFSFHCNEDFDTPTIWDQFLHLCFFHFLRMLVLFDIISPWSLGFSKWLSISYYSISISLYFKTNKQTKNPLIPQLLSGINSSVLWEKKKKKNFCHAIYIQSLIFHFPEVTLTTDLPNMGLVSTIFQSLLLVMPLFQEISLGYLPFLFSKNLTQLHMSLSGAQLSWTARC